LKKVSIIICTLLLAVVAVFIFSSRSIKVSAIPFGLPTGTKIPIGKKASFPSVPVGAEADLHHANDLRMAGAFHIAQDNYETILLKYPKLPAALYGAAYSIMADDSVSTEQIAKAKNFIESLSQQLPGSIWVQLLLTFSKEHEGSINNALNMAAELAAESPAFAEARLRYAELLLKNDQVAKAAEEAKAAISISAGSDARAYINLAYALHKMGNIKECAELVNYVLPRFPSQTELLLLHGYLSEYSREFDIAQSDYKKILALNPNDANAANALITLGEKKPPVANTANVSYSGTSLKDQSKETAKIILPLINEYPENLPLREALGRIYLKARMLKEAHQQFSEIYAQDFEYPNIKKLLNESSEEQQNKFVPQVQNNKNLADSLAKTFAALQKNSNFEYDELGRYLAHYGATFKEFFSKYSITRFERIDEKTFSEKYKLASFIYDNTIFFDSKKKFYATRAVIKDTSNENYYDYISNLLEHFFKKEIGTLGEGVATESGECHNDKWQGYSWISRDNFEVLMQGKKNPRRVFIVRLHAKRFPYTGNLCSYVSMALGKSRVPK
jgi:hypothetical protein